MHRLTPFDQEWNAVHRVIYTSRASRFFSAQGIDALVAVCRQKNNEADLTGLLLFHEGRFFQVLEGEETPLLATMQRITKDPRHIELRLIDHGAIEQRAFSAWRMGFETRIDQRRLPAASFALPDLLPPNSPYRGRDPGVRGHVRTFLSTLRQLPQAAAG